MNNAAPTTAGRARSLALSASPDTLWRAGVAGLTAIAAAFLFARLTVWPPHEDETLALFASRGSVGDLIRTVLGERGGAPLHFLFAWAITHTGGGLVELRLVSALFAIASVPLIAVLVARLTDRTVALVATAIVVPSWMLLFHGIYGRMYSIFLFTATLSYIALLSAIERRDRRGWILWGAGDARVHRHASLRRARGRVAGPLRALRATAPRSAAGVRRGRRARDPVLAQRHRARRAASTSASAAAERSSAARSRS